MYRAYQRERAGLEVPAPQPRPEHGDELLLVVDADGVAQPTGPEDPSAPGPAAVSRLRVDDEQLGDELQERRERLEVSMVTRVKHRRYLLSK
jgi:hypothetical protein